MSKQVTRMPTEAEGADSGESRTKAPRCRLQPNAGQKPPRCDAEPNVGQEALSRLSSRIL